MLNHIANKGFGGINGVLAMSCDVAGFDPRVWDWAGVDAGTRTFEKLFAHPVRRAMFDKYGAWTQFVFSGTGFHIIAGLEGNPIVGQVGKVRLNAWPGFVRCDWAAS